MKLRSLLENDNRKSQMKIHSMFIDGLKDDRWDVTIKGLGRFEFLTGGRKVKLGPIEHYGIFNDDYDETLNEIEDDYSLYNIEYITVDRALFNETKRVLFIAIFNDPTGAVDAIIEYFTDGTINSKVQDVCDNPLDVLYLKEIDNAINYINTYLTIL